MSADKTEYKKIQGQILQLLFDNAKATSFADISKLTQKPKSETEYHCDTLTKQGLIQSVSIPIGDRFLDGYAITVLGRKTIMEQ